MHEKEWEPRNQFARVKRNDEERVSGTGERKKGRRAASLKEEEGGREGKRPGERA